LADYYPVVEHVFYRIEQEMFELMEIVVDFLQEFDLLINKMNKTRRKKYSINLLQKLLYTYS
jgi:hypothetical protein